MHSSFNDAFPVFKSRCNILTTYKWRVVCVFLFAVLPAVAQPPTSTSPSARGKAQAQAQAPTPDQAPAQASGTAQAIRQVVRQDKWRQDVQPPMHTKHQQAQDQAQAQAQASAQAQAQAHTQANRCCCRWGVQQALMMCQRLCGYVLLRMLVRLWGWNVETKNLGPLALALLCIQRNAFEFTGSVL